MLKITIIAMGTKMPLWVVEGSNEYAKRLQEHTQLKIIEIPLIKRSKTSDIARIQDKESSQILSSLPPDALIIALDIEGKSFSSPDLAKKILQLQLHYSHICFIIGGPEGVSEKILKHCHEKWSLSRLTLPHPLVRIFLLETLYRAWAINNKHPYHK
ncbi:23S rRNA (pseudouridine(1915)-N(3))-methyltransferase RlmH [Legionella israelensis]|uniref:Ribosomal RNA large subunit methyltransferase H n=1 Tax=Legionella israelensis TaxID=454 RepID=A0A0W0VH75_9GAMM|nr:23S rRNA (pseudouridine(1915)-N(3))-methyltransferase RlmH [Legionella israelensis]KTD19457.1 rRNA large subunit methyltransferase [Legionella israelensis]QBS08397.1 23S rRNA (pseudouridine(1915)-N(3))-methyltransferase RlmH [Legionella israelensis]QDP72751.1 23S rRNA (pseudouridine(1915)-N(3))-methyltransferase RlmH [Legionella israelensis]SCX92234.1 23S rRNA (pseudouridine1915-N3)-methyltransferase [Legionella israelensis DSM 19235]STX58031.1 rRNA large subunit methyltransferase [Legionel